MGRSVRRGDRRTDGIRERGASWTSLLVRNRVVELRRVVQTSDGRKARTRHYPYAIVFGCDSEDSLERKKAGIADLGNLEWNLGGEATRPVLSTLLKLRPWTARRERSTW